MQTKTFHQRFAKVQGGYPKIATSCARQRIPLSFPTLPLSLDLATQVPCHDLRNASL